MTFDPYGIYDPYRYRINKTPRDLEEMSASTILFVALLLAAIGSFIYLYAGPAF